MILKRFTLTYKEETVDEDGVVVSTDDCICSQMEESKIYIDSLHPECNARQQILHKLYENIMNELNKKY